MVKVSSVGSHVLTLTNFLCHQVSCRTGDPLQFGAEAWSEVDVICATGFRLEELVRCRPIFAPQLTHPRHLCH